MLGPVPLAIYSTAHYQMPLVNIVQTSMSDVIFPDIIKRAQRDPPRACDCGNAPR